MSQDRDGDVQQQKLPDGKPLVSAIIIFYNAEEYICEAVESVVAQTYDAWELILVNDGSSDGSSQLVARYVSADPGRIRLIEHAGGQNRGTGPSRNLGVFHAQGKYVAFLDADDIWLPNKLMEQVLILEAHPEAALVYGNTRYWYSWTGRAEDLERDFVPPLGVPTGVVVGAPDLFLPQLNGTAAIPCTCSLMIRRNALLDVGSIDDSFRDLYEDQAMYSKLLLTKPAFVSGECWDLYRQHSESMCSASDLEQEQNARLRYLSWLESYIVDIGVQDARVEAAVRQARRRTQYPVFAKASRYLRRALGRFGPVSR